MSRTTVSSVIGPVTFVEPDKLTERNIIVVLDVSGSMSGGRLTCAHSALLEFKSMYEINQAVLFNHQAWTIHPDKIKDSKANGATNFSNAMETTKTVLDPGKLNVILFVTDGQEVTRGDIANCVKIIQGAAESHDLQFNSIGIYADQSLLLQLAQSGFSGTIQHVNDPADIIPAVRAIADAIENVSGMMRVVPTEESDVVTGDITALEVEAQRLLFKTLVQEATKKSVEGMKETLKTLGPLLESLGLGHGERGPFRDMLYELRHRAVNSLKGETPELISIISSELYGIPGSKSTSRAVDKANERILANYRTVGRYLDPDERLELDDNDLAEERWKNCQEVCSLSHLSPWEAAEDDDVFSIGWSRPESHSVVRILDPERSEIRVEPVFITWRSLMSLWKNSNGRAREEGVLPHTGSVVLHGAIPLVNCAAISKLLQISDAIIVAGDPRAITPHATPISGFLALWNLISREGWEQDWVLRAWGLVKPICQITLPRNMDWLAENFGKPTCRTPDVLPSLELFLMRCIVADKLDDRIITGLMIELIRRRINKVPHDSPEKWSLIQFWNTDLVKKDVDDVNTSACAKVMQNWMNDVWPHPEDINLKTGSLTTTLKEEVVEDRIKFAEGIWNGSRLWLVIQRYYQHHKKTPVQNPFPSFANVQEKHTFLVASMHDASDIKAEKVPDTRPKVDSELAAQLQQDDVGPIWAAFKNCSDKLQAVAILSLATERQVGRLRKLLRLAVDTPNYKYKLGLIHSQGNFVLRVVEDQNQVVFKHISAPRYHQKIKTL